MYSLKRIILKIKFKNLIYTTKQKNRFFFNRFPQRLLYTEQSIYIKSTQDCAKQI